MWMLSLPKFSSEKSRKFTTGIANRWLNKILSVYLLLFLDFFPSFRVLRGFRLFFKFLIQNKKIHPRRPPPSHRYKIRVKSIPCPDQRQNRLFVFPFAGVDLRVIIKPANNSYPRILIYNKPTNVFYVL